jgi:hypothetical protein
MSSTSAAPDLDVLRCVQDPAAWDVEQLPDDNGVGQMVGRVRAAVNVCGTCPIQRACLLQAEANPPQHPCVLGGLVWDVTIIYTKAGHTRRRSMTGRPFPQWRKSLSNRPKKPEAPEPARICGSADNYLWHMALGESGEGCGCAAAWRAEQAARHGVKADAKDEAVKTVAALRLERFGPAPVRELPGRPVDALDIDRRRRILCPELEDAGTVAFPLRRTA